jgi:hypothetical protein
LSADRIVALIEKASQELLSAKDADKKRGHLGASQIGHRCARNVWYSFRWAYRGQFTGRMMRLFDRGNKEEARCVRWLRAAGYEVRDHAQRLLYHAPTESYVCRDWECVGDPYDQFDMTLEDVSDNEHHISLAKQHGCGPKQWAFTAVGGHFSGSNDGKIRGPLLPEGWGNLEFKTMGDKAFKDVTAKGVLSSKPVYWVQAQTYMQELKLLWTLFMAINKNDDSIYIEIIYAKQEVGLQYAELAAKIIETNTPPKRLTEDSSWFECKFCDFREVCHYQKPPQKSCRMCVYSQTIPDGTWYCRLHHGTIPFDFQATGCDQYQAIT